MWNFRFPRNLTDREMREVLELVEIVERCRICGVIQDRREWVLDNSGLFLVKSRFSSLIAESSIS